MKKLGKMFQNTIVMIVAFNIALAVIALVKDVILATFLGTTAQADALLLAFFIPDTLGNNLLAAAVGITCLPIFTKVFVNKGKAQFDQSVKAIMLVSLLICFILTGLSLLFRENIIEAIGKGLSDDMKGIAVDLFTIMLPTMLIFPLITIGTSISNIHNSFRIPSFVPILFNLIFLGGITAAMIFDIPADKAVYLIAASITAGVFAMFLMIWGNIERKGWVRLFNKEKIMWSQQEIGSFFKMFLPYATVLFAYQSVLYIERHLASLLEAGTIAGLNYAYRIAQIPIWIFVAALSTFSFPSISKLKETKQEDELRKSVLKFLKMTFIIILPLTIVIQTLRLPIISILFRGGAFDTHSISITSDILSGYALAIIGQSIFMISLRFFMAIRKMLIPMLIVLFSSLVNIAADYLLVTVYGAAGLGFGAAIGSLCSGVLLIIFLDRELELQLLTKAASMARILVASLPVVVLVILFQRLWEWVDLRRNTLLNLSYGVVVFVVCVLVYLLSLKIWKVYDIRTKNILK